MTHGDAGAGTTEVVVEHDGNGPAERAVRIQKTAPDLDNRAYVLTGGVRNPNVPVELLASGPPFMDDGMSSADNEIVRRHRANSRVGLDAKRRANFIEEARNDPEGLYERVVAANRRPDFDDFVWDSAAKQRRYVQETVDYGGWGGAPAEPVGKGEMWWGESWWTLPHRVGMHGVWDDETGLLMLGGLDWDDGDLYQSSYNVISRFYLDPARMPSANRVRSTPGGVLVGEMFGHTGGSPIFGTYFDGDHWSKCRLRLHQRAFAVNPTNPVDAVPAAPFGWSEIPVLNVDGTFNFQFGRLPGGLPYPPIDIHLDKHRILRIDLQIELFIQLEGEAGIRFGGSGHANAAHYQASQWTLQPF